MCICFLFRGKVVFKKLRGFANLGVLDEYGWSTHAHHVFGGARTMPPHGKSHLCTELVTATHVLCDVILCHFMAVHLDDYIVRLQPVPFA